MSDVVIVVDMLQGFLQERYPLYCGSDAKQIVPEIRRLLEQVTAGGTTVLYLVDTHEKNDAEFAMFPPHCIRGTEECDVIPELYENFPGEKIPKSRFSGFYNTDLDDRLERLNPDKLIVVGVCTDICVLHTVADARNRDYAIEVPANCVASFDRDAHIWALKHMEKNN